MAGSRLSDSSSQQAWPDFLKQLKPSKPLVEDKAEAPSIVDMSKPKAANELKDLMTGQPVVRINDNYEEQFAELIISRNPQLYKANLEVKRNSLKDHLKQHYGKTPPWQKGAWVYYPWSGVLVHVLAEESFWEMRTIRNRDLITAKEQTAYRNIRVGCAGMSVGSSVPIALAIQGGAQHMKLVDSAVISGSNLNRILVGVDDIGREKSLAIARKLYEMNPYVKLERLKDSLSKGNLTEFFDQPWPLEIVVDEVDDLEIKIRLRVEARKRRLPVLMVTELGDDVMLDVERFDQNPKLPLFHGLAGAIEDILDAQSLTQRQWLKHATTIINTKNVPLSMQKSLLKVGSKIVTHPQLGGTAMVAGAVLAYAVRQLSLKKPLKNGRTIMSLDRHLLQKGRGVKYRYQHAKHTKIVQKALDSM